MKKFKEKLSKLNWERFFDRFQTALFAFAMLALALPIAMNFGSGKLSAVDGMRLVAIVWVFSAWSWWSQLQKKRQEFMRMLIENLTLQEQLLEQSIANKVLIETLNRIDKEILAKNGIVIQVQKPGKTIN